MDNDYNTILSDSNIIAYGGEDGDTLLGGEEGSMEGGQSDGSIIYYPFIPITHREPIDNITYPNQEDDIEIVGGSTEYFDDFIF